MKSLLISIVLLCLALTPVAADAGKPLVVLVHGAFADASSWDGVIAILEKDGFSVRAVANPLRGVRSDADYLAETFEGIDQPIVLVGHSYGGSVISEAATKMSRVSALVYVSALAPDIGETVAGLAGKFPGGTLDRAIAPPVELPDGVTDLYIRSDRFREQFAADVAPDKASLMAAAQRPVTAQALNEPQTGAAWKTIPSWFIFGDADRNIPAEAYRFMANRAGARQSLSIPGASHVVMVSQSNLVAKMIETAAAGG